MSLTPLRTPPYTRATRATRRRQCLTTGGSNRPDVRRPGDTPGSADAIGRSARNGQVATTARRPPGACARPAPRHRRAHRRRRPPLHGAAARRGAGGIGRAQPALPPARLAPAASRSPHRRHRPACGRSARPARQPEPMAANPARRPRRCPPSRRGGGHRLRRGVRRPRGADRRSDPGRGHPAGRHRGSRPAARAGKRVRGGDDPRAPADPFHVERLASPLPSLAEAAAGLAPFPLPKVPVQVSRYWTFKAGAGNAPSLPVVAFHVFAREAHGSLVELLKAAGARPPEEAASGSAMPSSSGTERVVRAVREAVEQDPETRTRLADAIARAASPAADARVQRLLERLVRLYTGPDSPYLDFYGPPRTIPTIPYDRALARLAARDGGLDVRGKAVFIGLSSHTGAEQRDGVNTIFSEPNGLDLSGVEVAATAFANIVEGAGRRARVRRGRARPRDRLGARARVPRVAPAAARLGHAPAAGRAAVPDGRAQPVHGHRAVAAAGRPARRPDRGRLRGVRALETSGHAARARAPVDRARPLPPAEDRRGAGARDR